MCAKSVRLLACLAGTALVSACVSSSDRRTDYPSSAQASFLEAIDRGHIVSVNGLTADRNLRVVLATAWFADDEIERAGIVAYQLGNDGEHGPSPVFPQSRFSDYQPVIEPEGWLLFTSTRPLDQGSSSARQNVWFSVRTGNAGWSVPRAVDGLQSTSWDGHALLLSPTRILFASDREGGSGMVDFYEADFDQGVARNIEAAHALNSEHSDNDGSYHRSSGVLIFARYDAASKDIDLYFSRRTRDRWSRPEALTRLNTGEWEFSPFITPDGCQLIFRRGEEPSMSRISTREIGLGFMCVEP